MSTVQSVFGKFLNRVDPVAKGTSVTVAGQKFKTASEGIAIVSVATDGGVIKVTATNHGLPNGTYVTIVGASGTYAASVNNTASNPAWIINDVVTDSFNLIGSTYTGAVTTGTIVPTMVGSVDGASKTRQRLLDIYNEARMVLFNILSETKTPFELDKLVCGTFTSTTATIAAYSAPYRIIAKPSGFLKLINLVDGAATPLRIDVLPSSLLEDVRTSVTSTYTSSATNLLAFEVGANWCIFGNFGTTPASVDYYGMTSWTWITDIYPNTTVESFRSDLEPILIEIACAIADEQSSADVNALAKMLLDKKGQ
jgi:hypothetical protein